VSDNVQTTSHGADSPKKNPLRSTCCSLPKLMNEIAAKSSQLGNKHRAAHKSPFTDLGSKTQSESLLCVTLFIVIRTGTNT
jgi:hypothetical protein